MSYGKVFNLLKDKFPLCLTVFHVSDILECSEYEVRKELKFLYDEKDINRFKAGRTYFYLYAKNERWTNVIRF